MNTFNKGDIFTIKTGEGSPLNGVKAKFIRQSPITSQCTVELLEDCGSAWKKGDLVSVKQWEMNYGKSPYQI